MKRVGIIAALFIDGSCMAVGRAKAKEKASGFINSKMLRIIA